MDAMIDMASMTKLMLFLEWMAKYTSWVLMFFDFSTSGLELAKVMIRLWVEGESLSLSFSLFVTSH